MRARLEAEECNQHQKASNKTVKTRIVRHQLALTGVLMNVHQNPLEILDPQSDLTPLPLRRVAVNQSCI